MLHDDKAKRYISLRVILLGGWLITPPPFVCTDNAWIVANKFFVPPQVNADHLGCNQYFVPEFQSRNSWHGPQSIETSNCWQTGPIKDVYEVHFIFLYHAQVLDSSWCAYECGKHKKLRTADLNQIGQSLAKHACMLFLPLNYPHIDVDLNKNNNTNYDESLTRIYLWQTCHNNCN